MSKYDDAPPFNIKRHAEREMAAFLKAVFDVFGLSGLRRAGEVWLQEMEVIDWPDANHEKYFRRVTIQAIFQLPSHFDADVRGDDPDLTADINWLPVLRTAP
jgi:hypothetical protein